MAKLLLVSLFLLCLHPLQAGSFRRALLAVKHYVDSADYKGVDSTYLHLPAEGFVVYVNAYFTGTRIVMDYETPEQTAFPDLSIDGNLSTRLATLFSVGVSYRGWGLSYSKDYSRYGDTEWCFMSYGQQRGLELRLHHANSLSGSLNGVRPSDPETYDFDVSDCAHRTALANFYWVFNHHRFSLPAAMTHTVIQQRSAGSWLGFFNYYHGSIRMKNDDLSLRLGEAILPQGVQGVANFERLSQSQISLGGGYAYNYVFARGRCLLHGSFTPMVSLWHRNRAYFDVAIWQQSHLQSHSTYTTSIPQHFTLNSALHGNFIYNSRGRWVSGLMGVLNTVSLPNSDFTAYTFSWTLRTFVGYRF